MDIRVDQILRRLGQIYSPKTIRFGHPGSNMASLTELSSLLY